MGIQLVISLLFFIVVLISARYKSKNRVYLVLDTSLIVVYLLVTITYLSANFFTGHGVDEAVIYTITYGLSDAGFGDYILLIASIIGAVILTFSLSYLYHKSIREYQYPKVSKIKAFVHNTFLIVAFLSHPLFSNLYNIYNYRNTTHSNDFYKYYKKPNITMIDGKKMNLVYIFAESFELTYFDEKLFPRLITHLRKIKNHSIEFTDVKQVVATGWTIGGITATQCAIPLFSSSEGDSMGGSDKYLSGAICLGDVLSKEGYYQVFMQGSSIKFSGIDKFFETHGYNEMHGREELRDRLEDKTYLDGWGLYDDSTFDMAYKKFEDLSNSNRPFSLSVMTIDTHHPKGRISKTCKEAGIKYGNGENSILNAVKCSDYLISNLIEKIKKSKHGKNTIIALTSDHLAMQNRASSILNRGDRRDFVMLIDPRDGGKHIIVNKPMLMFDQASMILNKLGVKTDLGLGRDILHKDSLATKFEDIDKKLYSWRDDILKLWEFPKLPSSIGVNLSNNSVDISSHKYQLPIYLKIEQDRSIHPYFDLDIVDKKQHISYQLSELENYKRFIWIDRCTKINFVYNTIWDNEICVVKGTLSKGVNIQGLDIDSNISTKIDIKHLIGSNEYNRTTYKMKKIIDMKFIEPVFSSIRDSSKVYHSSLKRGVDFAKIGYPNFIRRVWGVSSRESWGRWSDAKRSPTVKFQFKEYLPKKIILELKIGAYGKNIGKDTLIKIGNITKWVKILSSKPKIYRVEFKGVNSDTIELIPPIPQSPPKDGRKLGISFVYLKIGHY